MEKLTIVVSSTHTAEEKKEFIQHLAQTCGCSCNIVFVLNQNKTSLTSIYNKALNETKDSNYFCFIHDDIEFLKPNWGKEILRMFKENKEYGIIGVAGSAVYKSSNEKEHGAWWRYKEIYGQVLHRHEGKSWLTAFSPLLNKDLEEVVVIDGLFIAVAKNRLNNFFDEDFNEFDHYDTSLCIPNFISNKCKIGVTTNVRIAHNSIGQMRQSWEHWLNVLNDKYCDNFPLKVSKNK